MGQPIVAAAGFQPAFPSFARMHKAEPYATTYQTRQAFWLTIGWPTLHENAF